MQICQLTVAEAREFEEAGVVPDCHFHKHVSKTDAEYLVGSRLARSVGPRAIVAVGSSSLSEKLYRRMVNEDNGRYLGIARSGPDPLIPRSGPLRTRQLVDFMPRAMKHKVKEIGACGTRRRLMTANAVNAVTNQVGTGG